MSPRVYIPSEHCPVDVSRSTKLQRCGLFVAPGLTVCDKHADLHEFYLPSRMASFWASVKKQGPA